MYMMYSISVADVLESQEWNMITHNSSCHNQAPERDIMKCQVFYTPECYCKLWVNHRHTPADTWGSVTTNPKCIPLYRYTLATDTTLTYTLILGYSQSVCGVQSGRGFQETPSVWCVTKHFKHPNSKTCIHIGTEYQNAFSTKTFMHIWTTYECLSRAHFIKHISVVSSTYTLA